MATPWSSCTRAQSHTMKFTLALIAVCSALVSAFTFPEGLESQLNSMYGC